MESENSENVILEIVVGTYEKFLLGYQLEMNLDVCILPFYFVNVIILILWSMMKLFIGIICRCTVKYCCTACKQVA